ncbi:MAG TPA: hypothetical protein VFA41_11330 [Ktedonobacteraceae bacterium]|jgi:hypothetical protein|nr:hypothetical protein [Ktedonobacteraceae bacterium]
METIRSSLGTEEFQTRENERGENQVSSLVEDIQASQAIFFKAATSWLLKSHSLSSQERSEIVEESQQNSWVKALSIDPSSIKRSPSAYLASIGRTTTIDELRRRSYKRRRHFSPPAEYDTELYLEQTQPSVQFGLRDPAIEFDLREQIDEIVAAVAHLPYGQMYVMVCVLKDEAGPLFPLAEMFSKYGISIEDITWPRDCKKLQSMRTQKTLAQKALREKFHWPEKTVKARHISSK